MKKRLPYIILLVLIIAVEVVIALTQHGNFIRYYGGDIIVVWAVYCLVQSVIAKEKRRCFVHIGVMIFAFLVEILQAVNIVDLLGLGDIEFFRVLIGTSFAVEDLLCYAAGTAIGCVGTIIYDKIRRQKID